MTFTIKVRGATSGTVKAEYRCPVHGVFAAEVRRDENGDPPEWLHCSFGAEPGGPIACIEACGWTITGAPALKLPRATFFRGKSERRGNPLDIDTRPLAEGMPLDEWKAKRAKVWWDHDYAEFKRNT